MSSLVFKFELCDICGTSLWIEVYDDKYVINGKELPESLALVLDYVLLVDGLGLYTCIDVLYTVFKKVGTEYIFWPKTIRMLSEKLKEFFYWEDL